MTNGTASLLHYTTHSEYANELPPRVAHKPWRGHRRNSLALLRLCSLFQASTAPPGRSPDYQQNGSSYLMVVMRNDWMKAPLAPFVRSCRTAEPMLTIRAASRSSQPFAGMAALGCHHEALGSPPTTSIVDHGHSIVSFKTTNLGHFSIRIHVLTTSFEKWTIDILKSSSFLN
jgi:hypothetical protein